jgi:hypothetical protein
LVKIAFAYNLGNKTRSFSLREKARMRGKGGASSTSHVRTFQPQASQNRGIEAVGWVEGDLVVRWKSDPDKGVIAARLRRKTTLTIKATESGFHRIPR